MNEKNKKDSCHVFGRGSFFYSKIAEKILRKKYRGKDQNIFY
jgi:hypothetical protein